MSLIFQLILIFLFVCSSSSYPIQNVNQTFSKPEDTPQYSEENTEIVSVTSPKYTSNSELSTIEKLELIEIEPENSNESLPSRTKRAIINDKARGKRALVFRWENEIWYILCGICAKIRLLAGHFSYISNKK